MNDNTSFQRLSAVTAILAALLAFGSGALGWAAMSGNMTFALLADPSLMWAIAGLKADALRWSMILDIFGYYLLLAPLALWLWRWLEPKSPNLVRLCTFCGLAYLLIGAIGAAVLVAVAPPLINAYPQALSQQRDLLEVVFSGFINTVFLGLWNPLEIILGGVWWLGIGRLLHGERRWLANLSLILGGFALLDAAGRILNNTAVFAVGLSGVLLLIPIWALVFGLSLLRQPATPISQASSDKALTLGVMR